MIGMVSRIGSIEQRIDGYGCCSLLPTMTRCTNRRLRVFVFGIGGFDFHLVLGLVLLDLFLRGIGGNPQY